MEAADTVLRFLESLGRRSEAEFYLSLFRAEPKERFAAISVDANVARHATEAVTLDLRFLATLGLFPVVLLGLFDTKEAQEHAARIKRRLERAGVPATILEGSGAALHEAAIAATRAETIPIVPMVPTNGVDTSGPLTHAQVDERFERLVALLSALQTRKLIFLHRPGGLRREGTLIPNVDLTLDYDALWNSRDLSRKERALVSHSRQLVLDLPHKLLVTISSPLDLLRELFTVKGAGTLLRRGAHIELHDSFAGVDRDRLRALLTSSFGRPPDDAFFDRPAFAIYLEESYRGAAVLRQTPLRAAYLTKFAVGHEAQGEGIGGDLWRRLINEHLPFFWRARPANPIDAWYTKQADGMVRSGDWHVFWKGLDPMLIPSAVSYALMQPIDIPPAVE